MNRGIKFLLAAAMIIVACATAGCSNTPDTVEDPLSAYGIDGVLPFETSKPEVVAATPTPAPTVNPDELPTDAGYGKDWQTDTSGVDDTGGDFDDYYDDEPAAPTPKPTSRPSTAVDTGYAKLQYGDKGDGVKNLQRRLKTLGYYAGTVDGDFGSGTVAAIKTFQSIMGFTQSGIANVALQEALFSSSAPTYSATPAPVTRVTPRPTTAPSSSTGYARLQKGDTGADVTRLQKRLKTLGYYTGTADGDFGSATVSAVKKFQAAVGLAQTGVATVAVQTSLFSSTAPYFAEYDEFDDFDEFDDTGDEPVIEDEYVKLQKGSTGDRVYELQQRLGELGYYAGTLDGSYGSSTVTAVKLFQKTLGLNQTGVATVALQKKLFSTSAAAYEGEAEAGSGSYKTLSPGDAGSSVKKLQVRLDELGYYSGNPDGMYDAKTTKAVRLFQNSLGVSETGVASASLQKKLYADTAPFYEGQTTGDEPVSEYYELRKGDTGDDVTRLQSRLTALGYYTGKINGSYNAKTVTAVKLFEKRYSQPQTGVATVKLQKKLFSDDALPYEQDEPVDEGSDKTTEYARLEKGDSGTKVKKLQRRLKELGYFTGAIGGNYQKLTTDAVTRFQLAVGLNPTGVATVATQQALYADDAPYYETAGGNDYDISYSPLSRGDTGNDVSSLQSRLIDLGYIKDTSSLKSGTYDATTAYAVAEAQAARGFDSVGDEANTEFLTYLFSDAAWDYALIDYEGG